jgi:deazaflavin-dependent oxidoreductase (nitroreductase family)
MKAVPNVMAVIAEDYRRRPWWMSLIFYFCLYMTFIYMPFDFFLKPVASDHEIWFGLTLTGWWAKATEPLHWLIYGLGAYGFRHMRPWMWPWAGVYAAQVVIAMVVWNLVNERGGGVQAAIIAGLIFTVPMVALLRARDTFQQNSITNNEAMEEPMSQTTTLPDWAAEHMRRYLETDGEDGHIWRGVPTLLLTTTGRSSGLARMLPLIYGKDGDDHIIVASKGGHADHPSWYMNIEAKSEVVVQVAADKFTAQAELVSPEDRARIWQVMAEIWPPYNEYQEKTQRQIPLVRLRRQ